MRPEPYMTIAKAEQIEAAVEVGVLNAISRSDIAHARQILRARDEACVATNYNCEHCPHEQECKEAE